jgi:hypothetical protein
VVEGVKGLKGGRRGDTRWAGWTQVERLQGYIEQTSLFLFNIKILCKFIFLQSYTKGAFSSIVIILRDNEGWFFKFRTPFRSTSL